MHALAKREFCRVDEAETDFVIGVHLSVAQYAENLPAGCPPSNALEDALSPVFRLIPSATPEEAFFASKAALNAAQPPTYKGTDCEWASCSLFTSFEALLKIRGLRRRNKYIAQLSLPEGVGRHLTEGSHVHFWSYQGFQISSAVDAVWEHGQ